MMLELESYGFVEAGEWHLSERPKSKIEFRLGRRFADKRAIYAFVVDNKVEYIGICDDPKTTLKRRMATQRFNKDMPGKIEEALKVGEVVKIFASVPEALNYKGLKVDLVRGLEYPMIEQLKPQWNDELKKYRRQKQQDKKS